MVATARHRPHDHNMLPGVALGADDDLLVQPMLAAGEFPMKHIDEDAPRPPDRQGNRDLPAIQGTVLFGAMFIILAILVADILYAVLDPRVRY